jgi:hypothetical protein
LGSIIAFAFGPLIFNCRISLPGFANRGSRKFSVPGAHSDLGLAIPGLPFNAPSPCS